MKSPRTDGNFAISLLIKIQLWSGTRTTLTRFKDFIYTQYNGQISEPQKTSVANAKEACFANNFQDSVLIGLFQDRELRFTKSFARTRAVKLHTYKSAHFK